MTRGIRWAGSPKLLLLPLVCGFLTLGASHAQVREPAVNVVKVDLDHLIDVAAKERNRFAVDVPYSIDASQVGTWTISGGLATWRYSLKVPTAVSLSFHAANVVLPSSAQLTARGGGSTYVYRGTDIKRHELWSRISKGDSLDLEMTVAARDRHAVVLQIPTLQAGYRGFGHSVPDHPHYASLKLQARAGTTSSCIHNYECEASAANTPAGQATVAIVVANSYQCSGTLINDVPQDGSPYVLTARHCENGKLGGGNPGAASNVVVYWDATSACGSPLGTLYDPGIQTQQGAITVAEQQDAWLLLLDVAPVVDDAYFAGFDATGGSVQGGYTVHHALSNDKQFTAWSGKAFADTVQPSTLNVKYTSNFLDVVNSIGTTGPGASGSALFDQNDRLVGSLSLASTVGATGDGYDACPTASPPAPTPQNASAYFTSLSAVWNSASDKTSSTSTIKQALDPDNTGSLVVNSRRVPASVHLTASVPTLTIGDGVFLTWAGPGSSSCSAFGGDAGDGWNGTLVSSGSQFVRESVVGAVTFGISCTYPDGHTSKAQTIVTWVPPDPIVGLFGPTEAWVGGTWQLLWSSNVSPCQLMGGSASSALSGTSGTILVTETTAGKYDYHLSCGTGSRVASEDWFVDVIPPVVSLVPGSTDVRLGQALELAWHSLANSCTPSGGVANDGWSQTQAGGVGSFGFFPATVGTYTYSIACAQGNATAQATATITVENDPPYADLTVSSNKIAMGQSMTVSYKSNIAECILEQTPVADQPQGIFQMDLTGGPSEGTRTFVAGNIGASQLVLSCVDNSASPVQKTINSTPQTVTVVGTVTASILTPVTATAGTAFTLSWQTNNASSCSAAGGGSGQTQWSGPVALPSGQQNITPTAAGTLTYTLTCVGLVPSDTTTVKVEVQVSAPVSQPPAGGTGGSTGTGGGGGGGGTFDGLSLAMLGCVALYGWRRGQRRLGGLHCVCRRSSRARPQMPCRIVDRSRATSVIRGRTDHDRDWNICRLRKA